jgi:hypothetical protein
MRSAADMASVPMAGLPTFLFNAACSWRKEAIADSRVGPRSGLESALSHEFFFQPIAVSRDGCIADIWVPRFFKCLKLRFFGFADYKNLIYCGVAVDHCSSLRSKCRSYTSVVGRGEFAVHLLSLRLNLLAFSGTTCCK